MLLQLLFVLIAIIIGARLGGIGLGVVGGLGLAILTFVFGLEPTSPPIDVMLMIVAVIAAASCMQAAGGLDLMVKWAEKLLRKNPSKITLLSPLVTYIFTCGNGTCGLFGPSRDSGSGNGNEDTSRTTVGDCCDRVSAGNYGQPDLGGNRSIAQYVVGT